jgi:hypothetical protein
MESDKVELSMQWKQHTQGVTKAFIPTHLHIAFTALVEFFTLYKNVTNF